MARPQANKVDYFPHDNSMRNHRKVKMLRNKFGSVIGYAFWSMMLEWLTDHDGLEWEYSEIEIEMFASELGIAAEDVPPMVGYCIKIGLLFKSESGFIHSESLNETLDPIFKKRHREREKSRDRKRREDGKFKPQLMEVLPESTTSDGVSAAEMPQSKVEYSKVDINNNIVELDKPTTTTNKLKLSVKERAALFVEYFNKTKGKYCKIAGKFTVTKKVLQAFTLRIKKHDSGQIAKAIDAAFLDKNHIEKNYMYLTPEFILREDILERYINLTPIKQTQTSQRSEFTA